MLVLTRVRNQAVIVGNDVKVTVLDFRIGEAAVGGGQVKLGFQAPKEVCIQRQEVLDRTKSKTSSGSHRSKPNIAGKLQSVRDADVRLQI
jgi:carbon storage regulator